MRTVTRIFTIMIVCVVFNALGCKGNKGHKIDGSDEITVLVLYTPDAMHEAEDHGFLDFETRIQERVNYTNGVFMQSGIAHQLILSGTLMSKPQAAIAEDMDVTHLRQNKVRGWLTQQIQSEESAIHRARHESRADLLVIMHTSLSGSTSGQARITSGDEALDYERSHAAVTWSSANTFVHEIGHLFSAEHDAYRLNSVNVHPNTDYGQGYIDLEAGVRTIMAYSGECTHANVSCSRLPLFSNPYLFHAGVPLGDLDNAYNACVVARRGSYVSQFYEFWNGDTTWSRERLPRNCDEELLTIE